ncbi:30S ribosomal protein S9 [Patescibacteria group bacterium]|nr:30S ribosomal protein S9 [Patescibacteria group bacterium]
MVNKKITKKKSEAPVVKKKSTAVKKRPAKKTLSKPKVSKVKKELKDDKVVESESKIKYDFKFAVGRRKQAVARVRYYAKGDGEIIINDKKIQEYFPTIRLQNIIYEPLVLTNKKNEGKYTIKVKGGGIRGQADSIRLGISRLLFQNDKNIKPLLKTKKLLTVDSRVKERKKYGLKKARRAPQWQKR